MADRYWILGTGSWSSTNTVNWSDTSGGAGGFSVPTAADNVFFDANSNVGTGAFTVTMANSPRVCNDFTVSGLDGTMTLAGASIALTISGSLDWPATGFTRTYIGTTTFNATTTGKTVSTQNIAFGSSVTFDGVGGGWTLGSALNVSSGFCTLTNGTLDTSVSNYAITTIQFQSSGSTARTLNLNGSTITITGTGSSGWNPSGTTNLTFNAGTSLLVSTGASTIFSGNSLTYYDVSFTSAAVTAISINGSNTYRNLSITGRTTIGIGTFTLGGNQTINGTLTISAGTGAAYRTMITSDFFAFLGYNRTITCAAVSSLTDVDFRGIVFAGAASPASGTRLGNCAGNTGITFPAAKTVYFGQTGSADWGATGSGSWSATSGGALDATQFPLAQDTAVFPAATYPASGSTVTLNAAYNIGTIDMSLRTANTMTLSTTATGVYGNWINGTGITLSGTGTLTFFGRTTQQITSAGIAFTQNLLINSPSGTVTLQDAFTTGTARLVQLNTGTLNLNNFTLSTGLFSSNNTETRTIAFGTGQISCTGTGTVWSTSTTINLTTTGTQVVNVTSTGSTAITVNPGALSQANSVSFNFTGGTYALTFLTLSNHSARNVDFTGYAGTLGATSTAFIYGNLTLSTGMSLTSSASTLTFAATSGTKTITTNAKTIAFPVNFNGIGGTWQLQDALTLTTALTFTNGTVNLSGFTLSALGASLALGTKNITFNGGTLLLSGSGNSWNAANNPNNFTTTAGTGTGAISMTNAASKNFFGGGRIYNCTLNQGGAGVLTIADGANTFSNITNTRKSVSATSILFAAGTTSTFTDWNASGESTRLLTIGSDTAASHTLSKASGTVSADFLSISRSTATGGAGWYAGANSTDGGNNSGWIFTAPPAPPATATGSFLVFF